ncbi:hypothetical protein PVAND_010775 [Polypedilum vanderplanki]|uniref:Ionotropic glutamate receptor L-glutamate and glycine-binding domain-containing protein n=1 Tax=Polypedilum vanderplanki TaxID=319348 RepID=A0A9J6CHJ1_POLVA|nr:hypothetical protein PVAND_010775 [Polypedilum vanderplanki]
MSLLLLNYSSAKVNFKLLHNDGDFINIDLVNAVKYILNEVFFKHHRNVNLISAMKDQNNNSLKDLRNAILYEPLFDKTIYMVQLENHTVITRAYKNVKINFVIIIDSYDTFIKLNELITIDRFNFRGHYLFVFTKGHVGAENTQKMFSIMWKKGLYNVNFMYQDKNTIRMTNFRPFQRDTCHDMDEMLVDTFQDGSFKKANPKEMFSKNKFKNLYKCPIKIVTFERCPAMCYNKKENKFSGYDWELIQEISQQLNFKMEVKYLEGEEQWGTILSNGSLTGGLKELVEKRAEIGIGNYFLRESRTKIVDYSTAYFNIPIVLVIPPATKLSPFEKLLRPFEIIIWILLFITFSIGLLVIFMINYKIKKIKNFVFGRKVNTPTLNMFIAIFGQQQTILPGRNYARFILMMFLIFCLVNRNVYQGALYIFLQSDGRHKDIKSIDEMIEKDFKFYVYESYIDFVHNSSEIYKRKIIIRNESELPFSKEVDENLKAAFMTPQTNVINRNQMNQGKFSLKVCDEQVSVINIVMFFTRSFFLKLTIDEKLHYFDANGLLTYWINKHADKRYLNVKDADTGPKILLVEHLFGVFNIMLIGYAIATIIFILELTVFKIKEIKDRRASSKIIAISSVS